MAMRLKKLILHGFKSFADRTEFAFDAAITGIVGPNGCGKSNVVDGFKWVLGEQSAKSLRGEAMLDVIFNGSGNRKPAGLAEVTLIFDNPKSEDGQRTLNLDIDEVAIGRRLYRDGTSEYQINNQTSRLKDVKELFLDTGVGVDAYSVIEQGRVAALLEANPEERRLIFEEAAGISKFKQRKKESLRKLEKVDQNLLRVNDIVEEVEKRLRSVKVQAGKARTYQEHSSRLAELRLSFSLREYHQHRTRALALETAREEGQFRLDDVTGDLSRTQNLLATRRERFDSLSQGKQRLEYELVQARASMQAAQQRQHYAQQQLAQIAEQVSGFARDEEAAAIKLSELTQHLEADEKSLDALTQELHEKRELIDERQVAFRDGQLKLNTLNQQIESTKSNILDLMRKLALTNSRLGAIAIEKKNIGSQQDRLSARREMIAGELQTLDAARVQLQNNLEQAQSRIVDEQKQLDDKRVQGQALGKQIAQTGERLGAAREHRSGLISRQKLLKDLEARREGVSEGVKSVLRQRESKFPFIRGLVADVLGVDVEHAHVIEAALDGRDQWLVTSNSDSARAASEPLLELEGRINILCLDRQQPWTNGYNWNQHSQRVRIAADLVRCEPGDSQLAYHLLGRTVVVDDLAGAMELQRDGPPGHRYVTPAGEVVEADGTLRTGPLTASMGLLSRRSELQAISQQIADVDGRIEQLSQRVASDNSMARAIEEEIGALRNAIYASNTAKVEAASALAQNGDKQTALRREQPVIEQELDALGRTAQRLQNEEEELGEKRGGHEQQQASAQEKVEELTRAQMSTGESLKECSEQLTSARVQLGQVQEKQLAAQQAVARQTAAKAELSQQIDRIARSTADLENKRLGVEKELAGANHAEETLTRTQREHEARLHETAAHLSEAQKEVSELAEQVDVVRNNRQEVEEELHAVALQAGEEKVRLESLVQRTQDELQLDLPGRYAELTSGEQVFEPAQLDWDSVAQEIKELRDKIHRLGNVNVEAIGEQDELEQRQQFLSQQVTDLAESKMQLETLIDEINRESSLRFEATFNAVREHFQGMFRKLFGGGKADIYLETELPPKALPEGSTELFEAPKKIGVLDAGIEIIARPPGKQPVTISQLSGGEKTMTCVALLMSIFKSKPSAFCILDEVDAALDEANNQRFNAIVQEFLQQSQFIVITHSKRTMQIAEVLYGVTMQEQGVSKRVAVKFDQVDAQGRISEVAAA